MTDKTQNEIYHNLLLKKDFICCLLVFFIFFCHVPLCFSGPDDGQKKAPETIKNAGDTSLHITSDTMIVEKDTSVIEFSGNVVATRDDSVINADKIHVVLYSEKEKKSFPSDKKQQDVKMITATGNVKFVSGDRTAFADKAVYTSSDEVLVLTGDAPRVITGDNFVTGKKITLFQESGRVVIESGGPKRVEALFKTNPVKEKINR